VSHLPAASGRRVVKALARWGFLPTRQHGSHIVLRQEEPPHRRLTVPDHPVVAKGTLAAIAREGGVELHALAAALA
jgi:predicted RNA binding protein YcfA (HicA-like mRNA interferase family)